MGKGSIIFVIDQSGSMSKLDEQSKAFALALMSIARRQKRNFAYIPFSSSVGEVKFFKSGKIKPNEMVKLATEFMNGGTEFEAPLKKCLEVIKKDKFKDADVVFVTDGEDNVSDEFLQKFNTEKEKYKFSVMSLLIGSRDTGAVEQFSDKIVTVNDFNEKEAFKAFEI